MAIAVGGAVAMNSTFAAAAESTDSSAAAAAAEKLPKAQRPVNVNPDKSPVLDLSKIKPEVAAPVAPQKLIADALAWAKERPNSRIVCFNPDNTVAGMAELSRIDSRAPMSPSAADAFCNRAAPGTHA